ncbi:MAG: YgjV family protein [Clostridia bacterium]|nr:YgjV family protein [Clostridia bacterium]
MLNLLISMAELSDNMVKFLNETLGIWYLIIPNAFGVIAIVSKVTEMQLKSRKTILVFAIIASISWVLYFGLQGGFTSSLSCLIIAIQVIIFSLRNKYKWANSLFWLFFFITLQIVMCVLTLKNWYDVLPTIAGIISVFAYYVLDEDKYRILC